MIEPVIAIIQKKHLKLDPEVQPCEDALCLIFLEMQFSDFAHKESGKIVNIIRKTGLKCRHKGGSLR